MMNRLVSIIRIILVSAVLLSIHGAQAHEGATGVVKDRMDRFKASKESVKQLKKALKTKDWSVIQQGPKIFNNGHRKCRISFLKGAMESHLKPKTTSGHWEGFLHSVESYQKAQKLVSSNDDLLKQQRAFKGMLKSCKSCHNEFS